jgi:hypothetical protein
VNAADATAAHDPLSKVNFTQIRSVVASRGKTQRASDSATLPVDPTVLVELDGSARLEPEGAPSGSA